MLWVTLFIALAGAETLDKSRVRGRGRAENATGKGLSLSELWRTITVLVLAILSVPDLRDLCEKELSDERAHNMKRTLSQ